MISEIRYRNRSFYASVCGPPCWRNIMDALGTFKMEANIRERWWEIKEGDVVLDLGAGYGSYTLAALAAGASVVAIEPAVEVYFGLCVNLFLNGFQHRCLAAPVLVGERCEEVFDYNPETHSRRGRGEERRFAVNVDTLVVKYHLERLDWIKIDVEGDETAVLRGAMATLQRFHPRLLIEDHIGFIPGVDEEIRKLLVPLGYTEETWRDESQENGCWSRWTWKRTG